MGERVIERRRYPAFSQGDFVTETGTDVYLVTDLEGVSGSGVGATFKCLVEEGVPEGCVPLAKLGEEFWRNTKYFAKIDYKPGDVAPFEALMETITEVTSEEDAKQRELSAALYATSSEVERDRIITEMVSGKEDTTELAQMLRRQWVVDQFSAPKLVDFPLDGSGLLELLGRRE